MDTTSTKNECDKTYEQLLSENEHLRSQLKHCQRLATVGTMTAMIIHEFNNILTPIINYAQLAAGGDEMIVQKAITKADEGGRRATEICDALLGMLRDHATDPVDVDLADMIHESLLAIGRSPAKDGIQLTTDIPNGTSAKLRSGEFKQVLVNIILNARSAIMKNNQGGSIHISSEDIGDFVKLTITDNGGGIAPENLEKLFDPFFTTKTGQDDSEVGTGLGLAICKEIITRTGGDIWAESDYGHGASFIMKLPK